MGRPLGSVNKSKEVEVVKEEVKEEVIEKPKESLKPLQKEMQDKVYIEDGRYVMKDDGHFLCKTCNHRQDMHHIWREVEKSGIEKDIYGARREVTWIQKYKKFDVPVLPCQHACKCENFK